MQVYLITNTLNGFIYIGQTTKTIEVRWNYHLQNSHSADSGIDKAIRIVGKKFFTLSEICKAVSKEDLNNKEKLWTIALGSYLPEIGYNILIGNPGGVSSHTQQIKARIGRSTKMARNKLYQERPDIKEEHTRRILQHRCCQAGTRWITNGISNRRISANTPLTEGWEYGTNKSNESKRNKRITPYCSCGKEISYGAVSCQSCRGSRARTPRGLGKRKINKRLTSFINSLITETSRDIDYWST